MSEFTRLCPADRVTEGRVTIGRVGVRQVAVTKVNGALHAFKNTCPHAGSPLSGGTLQGTTITCPRHAWRFDVATGGCADQPMYELSLYDARERDGWIEVRERNPEIW